MMRYQFLILVSISLFLSCSVTDEDSLEPGDVFLKYYGDLSNHSAADMAVNENGEFILFGSKLFGDSPAQGTDFYFVRTDADGNVLAESSYDYMALRRTLNDDPQPGDTTFLDELVSTNVIPSRIKIVEDGYLVIGSASFLDEQLVPEETRLYAAKLNFQFEVVAELDLWASDVEFNSYKVVGGTDSTDLENVSVSGLDIVQSPSEPNNIFIVGYSDAPDSSNAVAALAGENFARQMLVGEYTLSGSEYRKVWRKTFGSGNGSNEEGAFIEVNNSGELVVVGSTSGKLGPQGESGINIQTWWLTTQGSSLGGVTIGISGDDVIGGGGTLSTFDDRPLGIYQGAEGFTLTGSSTVGTSSYAFQIGLSQDAGLLYSSLVYPALENTTFNVSGIGITRIADANLAIVGRIEEFSESTTDNNEGKQYQDQMIFLKTNQAGESISGLTRHYGIQNGDDEAADITTLADGRLAMLGTSDFGGGVRLFTLIKMNVDGEIAR